MTTNGINGFGPQQIGLTGNPEADAMRYAQAKGISLDEAKAELKSQFGDPQPLAPNSIFANPSQLMQMQIQNIPQGSSLFNNPAPQTGQQPPAPQTPEQMLCAKYGIPPEVAAQGDDAIRNFAEENNISLPAKNASSTSARTTASVTNTTSNSSTVTASNTASTSKTDAESNQVSGNSKMSRKEANAWIKNYRKEHNCSKKEAKEAFKNTFGYEVPKRDLSWIGLAGVGAFIATLATVFLTGKGSSSAALNAQKSKDYWASQGF